MAVKGNSGGQGKTWKNKQNCTFAEKKGKAKYQSDEGPAEGLADASGVNWWRTVLLGSIA